MRILQIDPSDTGTKVIDLHPRLSAVVGMSDEDRARFCDVVRAISGGGTAGASGLLEAHGILLDLNDDNLAMLDLKEQKPVVVGIQDVPGARDASEIRQAVERYVMSWPVGRHEGLDRTRSAYEAAKSACDELRSEAAEFRDKLHRAGGTREEAQSALNAVNQDLDPTAPQNLDRARSELAEIEAELGVASSEPPEARIGRIEGRLDEIHQTLENLPTGETRAVEAALALVRNPPQGGTRPDPEAQALADAVEALQREIVAFEESLAEEGISLAKAMADLEESRAELLEAEERLRRRDATPEESSELESIRDRMVEVESKMDSRIGGAKARKEFEQLQAREAEILDRLGYRSWTEYVMGSALLGVDPEAQDRLERARIDVEVRDQRWNNLAQRLETEPEYKEMLDRLEAVYLAAFDMLEGREPDDLAGTLRAMTVEVEPMTQLDAASELWDALEDAGVELEGEELPFEAILTAAEEWLGAIRRAEAMRPELEASALELRHDLDVAKSELAAAESGTEREPEVPDDPRWAAAVAKVNGANARYERFLASRNEVEPLERALQTAIAAESAAQALVEQAQARVDHAAVQERATRAALDDVIDALGQDPDVAVVIEAEAGLGLGPDPAGLDMFLLTSLTALRGVSYAGSIPLVLDCVLDPYDISDANAALARLEKLSDAVQVIVVTQSDDIALWVDGIGIEHGAVVEPGVVPL